MTILTASFTPAVDPARYAISGRAPRAALRPKTRDELCEILRAATRDGAAVVPWGGGVSLGAESAPERYDIAIDVGALDRVVEYEPEDLTLTAECGVTLAALRERLAARGQELPLEGAHAERATLGGVLAANASGPRRLRFGSPRDRVLGARFVLGDGTLARTGGKVVKNVAGYGIHRLLCGSQGGLAVIVEASLKLMPAPERRVALAYEVDAAALGDAARWSSLPRLEPAYVTVVRGAPVAGLSTRPGSAVAVIGLEDDDAWVTRQIAALTASLGAPAVRLEGADAVRLSHSLADLEEIAGPRLGFVTPSTTPAALAPVLAALGSGPFVFHASSGRLHAFAGGDSNAMLRGLAAHGFTWTDARGVAGVEPVIPREAAIEHLRRRIRASLDPGRRFALGDRWGSGGGSRGPDSPPGIAGVTDR